MLTFHVMAMFAIWSLGYVIYWLVSIVPHVMDPQSFVVNIQLHKTRINYATQFNLGLSFTMHHNGIYVTRILN